MTAVLDVLQPGAQTTVQDLGRWGYQALGIPPAGALDIPTLTVANHLVGNASNAAGLEIRLLGPLLRVGAGPLRVALCGTPTPLVVERDGERREVAPWRAVDCRTGDLLRIGALQESATAYLAVRGGILVPQVYGSRSTYLRGGLGGLDGRALAAGDALPIAPGEPGEAPLRVTPPARPDPHVLRVVLGPQQDWFTEEGVATFLSEPYRVTTEADRMGMRLDGPLLEHPRGYNLVSDGNVSGSIQVPGSRLPILLLAEHGTTGGYPKIATVISADLPKAGRLMPGAAVRFRSVTVEAAEEAAREAVRELRAVLASARPATEAAVDAAALHRENLISGVSGPPDW